MPARLLLVEDDELIREGLELALTDEGFDVVCAGSGEDALELLEAITVDVALLDLRLPA
jgi:DNA-binding response OmpR family regulator